MDKQTEKNINQAVDIICQIDKLSLESQAIIQNYLAKTIKRKIEFLK
jgi:hypothetical protein